MSNRKKFLGRTWGVFEILVLLGLFIVAVYNHFSEPSIQQNATELQAWMVKEVYPILKVRNHLVEQCILQWELSHTHVEDNWLKPGVAADDVVQACKAAAEMDTPLPVYKDHKQ